MINPKHRLRVILLQIVLLSALIVITPVFGGTGSIRISPEMPIVLSSPVTFTIWVEGGSTAYDPHIFLVLTKTSYDSLSGDVVVAWEDTGGGSVSISTWASPGSNLKLPTGTSSGAGYTIAALKSHLVTEEDIMWAFVPILNGPLNGTAVDITVTFPSGSNPHAMVYILGKSAEDGEGFDHDMRVPPTEGIRLLVPEVPYGTITVMASMLVALILYIKRPFF